MYKDESYLNKWFPTFNGCKQVELLSPLMCFYKRIFPFFSFFFWLGFTLQDYDVFYGNKKPEVFELQHDIIVVYTCYVVL
jgi:hypothetical protein